MYNWLYRKTYFQSLEITIHYMKTCLSLKTLSTEKPWPIYEKPWALTHEWALGKPISFDEKPWVQSTHSWVSTWKAQIILWKALSTEHSLMSEHSTHEWVTHSWVVSAHCSWVSAQYSGLFIKWPGLYKCSLMSECSVLRAFHKMIWAFQVLTQGFS